MILAVDIIFPVGSSGFIFYLAFLVRSAGLAAYRVARWAERVLMRCHETVTVLSTFQL
ncbi:uncharacterized protein BDV17DRAFT_250457 [Aspergillus undulatus]|uniref:uncharacterized protein n=1 Tax=Aspergillus undulatus TaxID=1810928 RepID=UPI003CCD05F3